MVYTRSSGENVQTRATRQAVKAQFKREKKRFQQMTTYSCSKKNIKQRQLEKELEEAQERISKLCDENMARENKYQLALQEIEQLKLTVDQQGEEKQTVIANAQERVRRLKEQNLACENKLLLTLQETKQLRLICDQKEEESKKEDKVIPPPVHHIHLPTRYSWQQVLDEASIDAQEPVVFAGEGDGAIGEQALNTNKKKWLIKRPNFRFPGTAYLLEHLQHGDEACTLPPLTSYTMLKTGVCDVKTGEPIYSYFPDDPFIYCSDYDVGITWKDLYKAIARCKPMGDRRFRLISIILSFDERSEQNMFTILFN